VTTTHALPLLPRGAARPRRRALLVAALAVATIALPLAAGLGWAAYAPIRLDSRDALFEIPAGTYARRMAGNRVEILPDHIELTQGLDDTLLLRNLDEVPQQFGPVLIMPGQSFRLPFEVASTYSFLCTAHASGQMNIVVAPMPAPGWQALRWRWDHRAQWRRWRA
jgi:hypothetical protein